MSLLQAGLSRRSPEFIPDISALWVPGELRSVIRAFLRRLEAKRELTEAATDRLYEAIQRVHDLHDYPFRAVELASTVEEEQVAEVFVRINSEGVTLNQADFILTLMSVFWEKGRRQLEEFSRGCKVPTLFGSIPVQLVHPAVASTDAPGVRRAGLPAGGA